MNETPKSPPKTENGHLDKEAIKAMYMASKFLNWTAFAEDQGWDALLVRREMPVKKWTLEKRDHLAAHQLEILSDLIHERKYKWTHEIIKTLDTYPEACDRALDLAKAKMNQMADMYNDYITNFRNKPERMYYKNRRIYHPFESLPPAQVGALLAGMKSVVDAKLKALMLDKWAISKLDVPLDQVPDENGEVPGIGPMFTIEGKTVVDGDDLQKWMGTYFDKPVEIPTQSPKKAEDGNGP